MHTWKPYARLAGFFLCLALLAALANTFLLQTDTVAYLTLAEMKSRSDIELAIVGSSVVRDHFDPALITERTGKAAFGAAVPCAALPADIAMTEEMLRTSSPEWVVAVMEPYNFNTTKEEFEAQYKLAPMLTSPKTALSYYLRLCRADGDYIDRLLLFRAQMASPAEIKKTLALRFNTQAAFEEIAKTFDPGVTYMGGGFLRYDIEADAQEEIRRRMQRQEATRWEYSLFPESQEALLDYKALCEAHGAKLMILIYPMHTAHALANPDFIPYNESLMAFCAENGIPCFNMAYAKPELMPNLDAYYFDLDHMNAEGARQLSEAFAQLFNRYTAGEDVSHLFYANQYEYMETIDFITNCWLTEEDGRYLADSNRAPGAAAEYRFVLRDAAGEETLLRDYSGEAAIEAEISEGCDLRVYARPAGKAQDPQVYFDYPADAIGGQ